MQRSVKITLGGMLAIAVVGGAGFGFRSWSASRRRAELELIARDRWATASRCLIGRPRGEKEAASVRLAAVAQTAAQDPENLGRAPPLRGRPAVGRPFSCAPSVIAEGFVPDDRLNRNLPRRQEALRSTPQFGLG